MKQTLTLIVAALALTTLPAVAMTTDGTAKTKSAKVPYAYTNLLGIGPNNDSR